MVKNKRKIKKGKQVRAVMDSASMNGDVHNIPSLEGGYEDGSEPEVS